MITKAYIEKLPEPGDNIFIVRIPVFESAGIGHTNNSWNTSNFEATLCYQPGNLKGYSVGDCVYVGFEADDISHPMILGKLYLGTESESSAFYCPGQLKVTDRTELSKDTMIEDINVYDILKKVQVLLNQ